MPKKNISDDKSQTNAFFAFVLAYYRNDAYLMMDRFCGEIASVADTVSINWYETRHNISLDAKIMKGRDVVGLSLPDRGRVSVVAFENVYSYTDDDGNNISIKYPTIRFNNFRKHFDGPALFDGFKALMDEFKRHTAGERVNRVVANNERRMAYERRIKLQAEELEQERQQAVESDRQWVNKLNVLTTPCPYFEDHGAHDLHTIVTLYYGKTVKGIAGEFTGLPLLSVKTWTFAGMQRIYPSTGEKIFRRGLNPSGAIFAVPARQPKDGEPIYVCEGSADAGVSFIVTGCYSAAALFADNLLAIVMAFREKCPNSDIIIIADNDQYGNENKGVNVAEEALMKTQGNTYLLIPNFTEEQKRTRPKDLSDFLRCNGEIATKNFLNSYKN